MTDHDRLAWALGRLAAARAASERRSALAGPGNAELHAARADFEEQARRSGLTGEQIARIAAVLAGSWRVDGGHATGDGAGGVHTRRGQAIPVSGMPRPR